MNPLRSSRFRHISAVLWALLAAFSFVGVLLKREAAFEFAVIIAIMWSLQRIIVEGLDAGVELAKKKDVPGDEQ